MSEEPQLPDGYVLHDLPATLMSCPRCHTTCGWCGDYRWHHGTMKLPGTRKYCTLPAMAPEGDACPICHGSRRVSRVCAYRPETPA